MKNIIRKWYTFHTEEQRSIFCIKLDGIGIKYSQLEYRQYAIPDGLYEVTVFTENSDQANSAKSVYMKITIS